MFGKLNIVNLATHPKLIYIFNAISNKIPDDFSAKISKLFPKHSQKFKNSKLAKETFKKKDTVGRHALPNFKSYYETPAMKTVWV